MSKKSAAIVTYHKSWNYGACLQAYASLLVFERMGFEAALVNYVNVDEEPKTSFDYISTGDYKSAFSTAVKNTFFSCRRNAVRAFGSFHDELKRTPYVSCSKDLGRLNVDLLVAGSDQIWNPEISGGELDSVFLLDVDVPIKKVSFASSAGSHVFTSAEQKKLAHALLGYDALSVREDFLGDQIQDAIGVRPFKCLDPTLLITSEQWELEEKIPAGVSEDDEFILAFTLKSNDREGAEFWSKLSDDLCLPVWRMTNNSYREKAVDRQLLGMTPEEFLWLIHHASFVVTDSFHGTAFSINYSTPFATLPSKSGNNARMHDLLDCCGLKDRFVDQARYHKMTNCSFDQADAYLSGKRIDCFDWLERVING